jgi:hypothetical protein
VAQAVIRAQHHPTKGEGLSKALQEILDIEEDEVPIYLDILARIGVRREDLLCKYISQGKITSDMLIKEGFKPIDAYELIEGITTGNDII